MRTNKLNQVIELYKPETVATLGGSPEAYTNTATFAAEVRFKSSSEASSNYTEYNTQFIEIYCHYRTDVSREDRIKFLGDFYDVEGFHPIGTNRLLKIHGRYINQ